MRTNTYQKYLLAMFGVAAVTNVVLQYCAQKKSLKILEEYYAAMARAKSNSET